MQESTAAIAADACFPDGGRRGTLNAGGTRGVGATESP
jgi:hypothetical protein